ncbi:hypothetical protein JZ751_007510, partial [Albula glossodonta]
MDPKDITIAALGRPLHPGMLYDCRNDTFIPGVSLWDKDAIKKHMIADPQPCTSFNFAASDSLSEKASLLDVNASLKASFLGGLVEVGGSAKYLRDKRSSMHQCRVTMQYKQTTEFKQLTMTQLGSVTYPQVFDQQTATHVVTAALYGAEAFMVFDQMASDEKEKQDIKGNLDVMIKKIPQVEISGSGKVVLTDEEKKKVEKFSCTFHGDFALEQNPSTYEEAVLVYKDLPKLLGEKGEKAVPVRVWLHPLEKLDSKAAKLVREIEVKLVSRVEAMMGQLHEAEMRTKDLISQCEAIRASDIKDKLAEFHSKLEDYTVPLLHSLGRVLPAIRAGTEEQQKLVNILNFHNESSFNHSKMGKWLDEKKTEVDVLRLYINSLRDVPIVPPGPDLRTVLLDPKIEYVIMFTFTSLKYEELYLSSLSEYPASASESRETGTISEEALPWYSDPKICKRMRGVVKYSEYLLECFKLYKPIISYVSDPSYPGASLYMYHQGELVQRNWPEDITLQGVSEGVDRVTLRMSSPLKLPSLQYRVEHREAQGSVEADWTVTVTPANQEELTLSGLRPSTEYQVRLSLVTAEGHCQLGETIQIHTKEPSAPENLRVEEVWSRSVRLRWDTPTKMEGVSYTYSITYTCDGEEPKEQSSGSSSSTADLCDLKPGVEYSFSICTVLHNGNRSRACSAQACTRPSPPGKLKISFVCETSARVSWDRLKGMEGVPHTFRVTWGNPREQSESFTTYENSTVLSHLRPGTDYSISICTVLQSTGLQSESVHTTVC